MKSTSPEQQSPETTGPGNDTFGREDDLKRLEEDFETIGICRFPWIEENYVMDEKDAEMVMRSVRAVQAEMVTLKENFDKKMAELKSTEGGIFRIFGCYLETLTAKLIKAQGGKKKSITMLWGKMGFRTGRNKIEISNEEEFVKFVGEHDELSMTDLIKYKPTISKSLLMEMFEENGEVLEHCTFTEGREKFFCQ